MVISLQTVYVQKTVRVPLSVDKVLQKALKAARKERKDSKLSEAKFIAELVEKGLQHG